MILKKCLLFLLILPFHLFAKEKINLIWQCGRNGLWETDWIAEVLSDFDVHEVVDGKFEVAMDQSIIVIGNYRGEYFSKLKEKNYRFGVIHISDEVYEHSTHFYPLADFVFRNYWHKQFRDMKNVYPLPLGCKYGFACSPDQVKDVSSREYTWSFVGVVIDHLTRWNMMHHMRQIPNWFFHEIYRFNDPASLSTQEYRNIFLRSIFAPCPRGYWNLDSFRVYEALEAGCIPIVEKQPCDYFALLFGDHPFIAVNSWDEAPGIILPLLQDVVALESLRQKCHRWWENLKKETKQQFNTVIQRAFFGESDHILVRASSSLKDNLAAYASQGYQHISVMDVAETEGWEEDSAWATIVDFLTKHSDWKLAARKFDAEGMVTLERCEPSSGRQAQECAIDAALHNKVILCTGPSWNKRQQLIERVEKERKTIPFKKIFISTTDPEIVGLEFPGCPTSTCLIERKEFEIVNLNGVMIDPVQLDCLNCMISTIRNAVNDPECLDDDIILFKHETVILNDMYLLRKVLGKLIEGYDMVARHWYIDHFYMTDAFFLKVGAARDIFKHQELVPSFDENHRFCEEYLTKQLFSQVPKIYKVDYYHSTKKAGELGLYHIPRLENSGYHYWDKANYLDLFR